MFPRINSQLRDLAKPHAVELEFRPPGVITKGPGVMIVLGGGVNPTYDGVAGEQLRRFFADPSSGESWPRTEYPWGTVLEVPLPAKFDLVEEGPPPPSHVNGKRLIL